jgi:hypothetical protein
MVAAYVLDAGVQFGARVDQRMQSALDDGCRHIDGFLSVIEVTRGNGGM